MLPEIAGEWADTGGDVAGGAAKIKTFQERVDSTLRDAAAARGFEVPAYVGIEDFPISSA